ncbi:MAG: CDP-glucose 4,6-dehydratase [Mariprofundales bacterium]
MFNSIYKNKRVLVTGHTGFKGSWLCVWLESLGANVTGYSLSPPTQPNHYELLDFQHDSVINDVRNYQKLLEVFNSCQPAIVFHLAAQPSVLVSYQDPVETFSSNVIGTTHVLEACRQSNSVCAVVIITTDKCYDNKEWHWGYRECDSLGGHDPYSTSKACAELVTASYRKSFFTTTNKEKNKPLLLASARAGNVIGGGDWTDDRLIPDTMRAAAENKAVIIRNPSSKRPWQHVLEPLAGYLILGQYLLEGVENVAEAWNFGSSAESNCTTKEVVNMMHKYWPNISGKCIKTEDAPHEAGLLMLDSSKAINILKWLPIWDIDMTIRHTVDWYRIFTEQGRVITKQQIDEFVHDAVKKGAMWAL